jgi:hypothetical protein
MLGCALVQLGTEGSGCELCDLVEKTLGETTRGSFSETWFRRYRRTEIELGRRVSFPRGFQGVAAGDETGREWADLF